jgi:hypothetical protein
LDETVTMLQVGEHYGQGVFEPINTYLRSSEDGLRFYRSMNATDPYDGPLDVAPWHVAVVGEEPDDTNWLIGPVRYDPTALPLHREGAQPKTHPSGGDALNSGPGNFDLVTPTGAATPLGAHTASTPQDIDLGLLSELAQAVTRGVGDLHSPQRAPPELCDIRATVSHHNQLVPNDTAPSSPNIAATATPPEAIVETSMTAVVGALGAVAGAAAG